MRPGVARRSDGWTRASGIPVQAACMSARIQLLCLCGVYLYMPRHVSENLYVSLRVCCPSLCAWESLCFSPRLWGPVISGVIS